MNSLSSLSAAQLRSMAILLSMLGSALATVQAAVSQSPLIIGSDIPGSLALVPSVEWPTVLSVANIGNYVSSTRYSGYFDSGKCYLYQYGTQDVDRYFYPVGTTSSVSNFRCTGDKQWSGNFLNWAATPTIDPFRSALTGGNRIVDSTTSTILQKARHSGQNSAGNRINTGQSMAQLTGALPLNNWANLNIRLQGLNFDMLISNWSDKVGGSESSGEGQAEWVDYDPENTAQWSGGKLNVAYTPRGQSVKSVYRLKIQVKVCVSEALKEANCKLYPNGQYKPEGLLQQYSDRLRYSAFSYLNDGDPLRDGGVLRANQAYIGPNPPDQAKNRAEWSSTTGILITNPSPAEASAASEKIDTNNRIVNSGVINYINKFGSMPYSGNIYKNLKDYDPVSELYYTAIRYFKNQGNVTAYSELTGDSNSRYAQADGFPVVTNWNDPINYSCQKNVILGIGDVNTWNDKNLPGNTVRDSEPDVPPEVKADDSDGDKADANKRLGVSKWTAKVASLEGITINTPFTGRGNSAYIAGLAYDAHVRDQRGDLPGKQTISTYWVDVRENQQLTAKASNQYWLATKYGGFTVPQDFDPDKATSASITESMWTTNGQTLSTGDKRPDNFFVGGDADAMVSGLKSAFAKIVQETSTTSTSLGSNSSQLETGSALFKGSFEPKYWSGDLQYLPVSSSGTFSNIATWSAAALLDSSSAEARNILTSNVLASSDRALDTNVTYSSGGRSFSWNLLDDDAKTALRQTADGTTLVSENEGEARLKYLRGDRSYETRSSNPMRVRKSRLGDIVNSDPYYLGPMDFGYNLLSGTSWGKAGTSYLNFRQSIKDNKSFVMVGANDGMLHAFDTSTDGGGNELFAFVPRTLLGQLYRLTQRDYSHRYYVDGGITAGHAWVDSAWKTLAVGTTGAGGNAVFALDVTDPSAPSVKWEFSSSQMNYPIQRPSLVALENGKFGVIVTSGFVNGTTTSGKVWILDADNGSVMASFTVDTTGGLGEPVAVDLTNDRIADRLYVPDTSGNVWRFDLRGDNPSNWGIPSTLKSRPLFTARAGNADTDAVQPITSALSVIINKDGNPLVLFGTGSYYQTGDSDIPASPRLESYYGLIDKGVTIKRGDLIQQRFIAQQSVGTRIARVVSNNDVLADKSGWYLNLVFGSTNQGERIVSRSNLRNGVLTVSSLIPSSDACKGGGISPLLRIDAQTGSRLSYNALDINGDGVINDQDYYVASDGSKVPYSGYIDTQEGIIKTPTFVNRGDSADTDLICYIGSATGQAKCEPVSKGSRVSERASWREIR